MTNSVPGLGAGEQIENTLSAFEHAAKLGTDMFELDVHCTTDGKVRASGFVCVPLVFGFSFSYIYILYIL